MPISAEPLVEERLRAEAERTDRSPAWVINYYILKGLEAMEVMPKTHRQGWATR
jgi:predicted DNA-binding protein